MKKQTLAAVAAAIVVLAGGYVGATAYTGHRVAMAFDAQLERVKKEAPFVHIDRKVETGLFSSTFSTSVRFACPNSGSANDALASETGEPFVIQFREHVRHGPLPGFAEFGAATIDLQIALPATAPQALRTYVEGLKRGDMRMHVGYGGGYRMSLRLPAGEVIAGNGKFKWPESHITGAGRLDGETSAVEVMLPELSFSSDKDKGSSFRIADLQLRSHIQGSTSLWAPSGTSTLTIGSVDVQTQMGDKPLSMQVSRVNYTSEVVSDNDLMNGKIAVTADASLKLGDDAKPFQLENIELQESFKRLHIPTLRKAVEISWAAMPGCDPTVERAGEQGEMLMQFLPHDPEIAIDKFGMTHEGRRGELSYSAGVLDFEPKEGETLAMAQPRLMQALTLRANARLPVAWIEQFSALGGDAGTVQQRRVNTETMLDMMIGKGQVVREGDDISASLVFARGAASLNGKPLGPQPK